MRARIRTAGYASHQRGLPALVAGADALALVSLWEGFGLPVLEAMACGTAVLTSNCSSLPEVAGDAAQLVDPCDTAAIADGLERLLTDDACRTRLAAQGPRTRQAVFLGAHCPAYRGGGKAAGVDIFQLGMVDLFSKCFSLRSFVALGLRR